MNKKESEEISKFLSYVLRHEPQSIGLTLDAEGWASIDSLLDSSQKAGRILDLSLLEKIVAESSKKRFSISPDRKFIRATQGHSTASVCIKHSELTPPDRLYHGTATRFLQSILDNGLVAGARHHVHLSEDLETAKSVGQRYGKPVVLEVEALLMHNMGFKFFQAENGVWLVSSVPAELLSVKAQPSTSKD
ncbi:RNA 2'-phosphotransferase [Pseudomonas sp. CC120222-01a]|uniref:RNA 2'-phosphotransferase n=1 Tax=Pseudomonas sp. CC120222-01a TaxID=1378075 RepID=UPI000D90F418|nr:RNA 2'-phosphotransferase [Pseudomonas sp. CC120222-01a]PVZ40275.1 putative RNA 2'-phosphotransferase [Pseudomonas sp. CC120222-01a]